MISPMQQNLQKIYSQLLKMHGPQGWWPLLCCKGTNPTKTGSMRGYHPGDYSYPKDDDQLFEICVGAILTQNTAWQNVERALVNLRKEGLISPKKMLTTHDSRLTALIKPAGYFNQKARKLQEFSKFYLRLGGKTPARDELLSVWGIGKETADSMLLYAYKIPVFVVDAYTKRIMQHLGCIDEGAGYDEIQGIFHESLERDLIVFQEYHALIVEHAKRHYSGREHGKDCPLKRFSK